MIFLCKEPNQEFDIMNYKRNNTISSALTAGLLSVLFLVASCSTPSSKDESENDSTAVEEVASSHSDAQMSSTGMRDKAIREYTTKYPELEYTFVRTPDGKYATTRGNYELKVKGIEDEKDLQDFIIYMEETYASNKKSRSEFNKNIEEKAAPSKGYEAYYTALSENTNYPEEALEAEVGATVFVEFVVTENGEVTNVKSQEGMYYTRDRLYMNQLDEAAVNAVKATSWEWEPARQGERAVEMKLEIPITFDPNS